jgi:membrane protease YdiL (CAAX protease family)
MEDVKTTNIVTGSEYSILKTFLWMLLLTFGLQGIVGFITAIVIGVDLGASGEGTNGIELTLLQPSIIVITGVISAILLFPLIKKAAHQSIKSFPFQFLAFKPVNKTTLIKVLLLGVGYYIIEWLATYVFSIDTPQFMLDVKSQTHSTLDALMLVLGICIIAPITEEIIFRGLAYGRLVKTKVGVSGAIIITSLFFTIIHVQYDLIVLSILCLFAFILGYVRYKTENLIYCIVLHMQINLFSTIELFFFL